MGGGPQGPSAAQIRAQQQHERAMMAMQKQMLQAQMDQQQTMLQSQMEAAERQRLASEQAAKEAAAQAQSAAALQAAQQNQAQISQQLQGKDVMQQLADEKALQEYQKALTTGAENVTGGYDIESTKQKALEQLGAASPLLPTSQQNLAAQQNLMNPAETTAATAKKNQTTNAFVLPATSDLTFGGI
jgi:hypothetical protein